jgi:PAS domain S-box-containing protein
MKWLETIKSFPKRSQTVIAIFILTIFTTLAFLFYSHNSKQQSTNQWVAHTSEVLFITSKIMLSVTDNETFSGSFVITAKPAYLEPLKKSKTDITNHIQQLKELTKDNHNQQADIDSLIFYSNMRMLFSDSTVQLRKQSGLQAAAQLVSTGAGKSYTDKTHRFINQFEQNELSLLQQRKAAATRLYNNIILFVGILIFIVVIILLWLLRKNRFLAALERNTKDKLKKNEALFSLMVSNIKDYAIFMLDSEGYVISWNTGAERINGYSAREILGKSTDIFYTKEDLELAIPNKNLQQALMLGHYESEGWRIRKDGTLFWANVVFTPLYNEQEGVYGYAKVTRDVTERKKAEEEIIKLNSKLEEKVASRTEQLKKANEELEAFSYSVSHDLRAPLRGIIGFASILEEDYAGRLDEEAKRITGIIKKNTLKMGCLIDDLLSFSRIGRQQIVKSAIHSSQMVKEVIVESDEKNHNGQVKWQIATLPDIVADPNAIRQVWVNLIANAVKYSQKQPFPEIEIGTLTAEQETIFFVKDNGVGFDENYKDKLFKVFQRLHSAADFEGTGVGLAIVERIISKHGGKVWATGKPGKGACFYFSLPDKTTDNIN